MPFSPSSSIYNLTIFQSQGQTLDEVIIDFSSKRTRISNGAFYTALSRVRNGKSVFLKDFKHEYVKAEKNVEEKLTTMEIFTPYTFKRVYCDQDIFDGESVPKEIKLGYINTNNLLSGHSVLFLNSNSNILSLDILVVADTRLTDDTTSDGLDSLLTNWNVIDRLDAVDGRQHMGMIVLLSRTSPFLKEDFAIISKKGYNPDKDMVYVQTSKITILSLKLQIGFGYIRETPNEEELLKITKGFRNCSVVIGDFNLDPNRASDLKKLDFMCGPTRERHLREVTTSNFNQLDHILVEKSLAKQCFSTSFYNPTSDHRTVTIRIPMKAKFSSKFLEDLNFDKEKWTKKSPIFKKPLSPKSKKIYLDVSRVNEYVDILKKSTNIPIMYTSFIKDIMHTSFNDLHEDYHQVSLLQEKLIIIPFYYSIAEECIELMLILQNRKITVFMPENKDYEEYNYVSICKSVESNFFDHLYKTFDVSKESFEYELVPAPFTLRADQVWLYLLLRAKYFIFGSPFDSKVNLESANGVIMKELATGKINR